MKFNIMRPLLILVTAYASNTIITSIAMAAGVEKEQAETYGFIGMMAAVVLAYLRLTRPKRKS